MANWTDSTRSGCTWLGVLGLVAAALMVLGAMLAKGC